MGSLALGCTMPSAHGSLGYGPPATRLHYAPPVTQLGREAVNALTFLLDYLWD